MNTLDKQIQGIIQESVSKTMNIKIPLQDNDQERNLLLKIMEQQKILEKKVNELRITIEQLRSDISTIKHHHEYYC